jgi:hypothetical protein
MTRFASSKQFFLSVGVSDRLNWLAALIQNAGTPERNLLSDTPLRKETWSKSDAV